MRMVTLLIFDEVMSGFRASLRWVHRSLTSVGGKILLAFREQGGFGRVGMALVGGHFGRP